MQAALSGRRFDPTRKRGDAALERAGAAYGTLDCKGARAAAAEAVLAFAALQANGDSVDDELRRAYAYELLCADTAGDADAAFAAASRLRRLGDAPDQAPTGVSEAVWQRYPALDATAATLLATVRVETSPTGGTVWIDHRAVGTAPLVAHLPEGTHVFATAVGGGAAALNATFVNWGPHDVVVDAPAPPSGRLDEIRRVVQRVRAQGQPPTGAEVAELMGLLGVDRLVVAVSGTNTTGWVLPGGSSDAELVVEAGDIDTATARLVAWTPGAQVAPTAPVPAEGTGDPGTDPDAAQPWWVYAAIGGAVAAGVLAIVLSDVSSSRQRIELTIDPP